MSTIKTLGPVGFNLMGEYSATTQYHRLDVVIYNGVSYAAIQDTLGQVPTNTTYWDALGVSGADMSNYYTKSQTDDLISAISTMDLKVVESLPTQDISTTTIYLVPTASSQTNNAYDEYIYVSNNWEFIGSTQVDLTDYVKNTDYATDNKGGVIKTGHQFTLDENNKAQCNTYNYSNYNNAENNTFVSKGTLENVITGKGLTTKAYVDELVGDVESLLETLDVGSGV